MNAEARRLQILEILTNSKKAIPGTELSKQLNVSRQIIVSDIALLRASNYEIISTNRGYIIKTEQNISCVVKVNHTDDQIADELNTIVDNGGTVKDVYVNHKIYGTIKAELNIRSRRNVSELINGIKSGKSTPLKNITSGYHYHTITADSYEILDLIKNELDKKGYLIEQ